jgi:alpha-beta hydrolase superfamily lysophospholipase
VTTCTLRVDVADVAPAGVRELAVDIHEPASPGDRTVVCVCVPGGGMSRGYFDLQPPPELGNYSMVRHLTDRGFVVVTVDPPAVGESDTPDDGYTLTPEVVADVDARAIEQVLARWPDAFRIGIGHSAGALLTVVQQAHHHTYGALGLLGFGSGGHERFALSKDELGVGDDPDDLRAAIVELTRERFGRPLPRGSTSTSPFLLGGMDVPEPVLDALGSVKSALLGIVGLTSMIPGSVAEEMAAVDVPVFLGLGEHDIAGDPHGIPAFFGGCPDLTLFVLPGAGHNHNVAPEREVLWERLAVWARQI